MDEVTHFRGFAVELREERAGRPVYPLWDDIEVDAEDVYYNYNRRSRPRG